MASKILQYVLEYNECPPSNNAGGGGARVHWGQAHREKKRWEGIFALLLISKRVPRGMTHCTTSVQLQFTRKARRDAENYRQSFAKPWADALVAGGWLPDDCAEYFTLEKVDIVSEVLPKVGLYKGRTTIYLAAEYA
jgi:hypothetical protein